MNLIEFNFPPISKQRQMQREDGHQISTGNKCDIVLFLREQSQVSQRETVSNIIIFDMQ